MGLGVALEGGMSHFAAFESFKDALRLDQLAEAATGAGKVGGSR